jgi:hypothetical protein
MKKLIVLAMLALAIPAAAIAADPTPGTPAQSSEAACRAQRTAIGLAAFKLLYAPAANATQANAFGKCVSAANKVAAANHAAAVTSCKAAQDADRAAFKAKYGSFSKCVAATTAAANQTVQTATISAAKSCKAERTAGAAAFTTKYATNASKSNAFGKCVAAKVHATP